jgi:hypothetical protein
MTKNQLREIIQLILVADHYYNLTTKLISKLSQHSKKIKIKIKELSEKFQKSIGSEADRELLILVGHMSSCGIRISSIYEVMKIKPNNDELYGKEPLNAKYICFFLRDNVCHREPGDEDKKMFNRRQRYLDNLPICDLYDLVRHALIECKEKVIEISANYKILEDITSQLFSFR